MKKILNLMMVVAAIVSSCSKSATAPDDNGGNNNTNSTVVTGNFIITKFTDSNPNDDNAADFSDYVFTFNANGTITATEDGNSEQGSYSMKPSQEGEAAKLTITFNTPDLDELNKKWQVDLISDAAIHLSDDGNASEMLQFTAQ